MTTPDLTSRMHLDRRWQPLSIVAAISALVSALAMAWQAVHNELLSKAGGCGFDGAQYCAMARGHQAQAPFSRRIVPSAIVRLAHFGSVITRFQRLNILAACVTALAVGVIVYRLSTGPQRRAAAVIAGALVPLWPLMWHQVFVAPASTDIVAMAFGMSWVAAVTRDRPGWYTPVLAALTVLSREAWVGPIVLAVAVIAWRRRDLAARMTVDVVVAIAAVLVALLQPSLPGGPDTGFVATFRLWLGDNFGGKHDLARLAWFVGSGMGYMWLVLIRRPGRLLVDWRREVLLALAAAHALFALIGGGDTDRLLLTAGVTLTALAVVELSDREIPVMPFVLLELASILMWRPWHNSGPTTAAYIHYWALRAAPWAPQGMRDRILLDARLIGVPLVLGGAMLLLWRRESPANA